MADKNKNGIDDKYEKFKAGQTIKSPAGIPGTRAREIPETNWLGAMLTRPVRQGLNFIGDSALAFSGQGGRSNADRAGTGLGDTIFGVTPGYYDERNRAVQAAAKKSGAPKPTGMPALSGGAKEVSQPSLLDFLSQAGSIVDQLGIGDGGGGGGGGIDYSGAIANANANAATNRGHIAGIYDQLRQGLAQDRTGIAENFGGAIDRSQQIAQEAQTATRGAYDAAQAQQDQAVQALGMQQAAASQQLDRPTTQQMAADAIGDSAARAQNAQTQYNSQQANATQHNQNVESASRFGETRAQGELDASLSERLAELAQLQAEADYASRASAPIDSGARGSSILSLAQSLYGDSQNQSQQNYENELAMAKLMGSQQAAAPGYTLEQLMRGQADSGLNQQDYLSYMKLLNSLNG